MNPSDVHNPDVNPSETLFRRPNGTWGWYDESWNDGDGVEYINGKEATKVQRSYRNSLKTWVSALEVAALDPELGDAYPRIGVKFKDLDPERQKVILQKFKTWYDNEDF